MSLITVAEAAKIVSKDRKTLYRWIKEGRISATTDALGNKTIDTAELARVGLTMTLEAPQQVNDKGAQFEKQLAALERQLRDKDEQIAELRKDKERLFTLLEDKRQEQPPEAPKGIFRKIFG